MPSGDLQIDSTAPAVEREPDQLSLRLFARVGRYGRNPPERALWRELIDIAMQSDPRFEVGGHTVRAADVHHVALAVYMRANDGGVVEDFSLWRLAADTRRSERTVRAAVKVLNALRVFRSTRPSRRKPAVHRLNVGGLDWPAVRARAVASAAQPAALSAAQPAALKGYTEGLPLDPDPDLGSEAAAVPVARAQEQQQQRATDRIENLLGAIASRCRRLGQPFDEFVCRASLADGRIDVDDLQHLLNTLPDTRRRGARP